MSSDRQTFQSKFQRLTMILNKITRINSALLMPSILVTHSHLMSSKLNAFCFANDWTSNRGQKQFKSQTNTDRASKSESMFTPGSESSSRRLFKRSSDQVANPTPTPQLQPSNQPTSQPNNQPTSQPNNEPTSQLSQQSAHKLSSYTFRTCELLLNTFKDQAKQSKDASSLLDLFDNYQRRLKENNIETTQLKDSHKTIMYASVMRALSRILRRQQYVDRARLIAFLGKDYHAIAGLDLGVLSTLEVSDFVAFFFLFQVVYKFRTFSQATVAVADKYLQQLYNRYTQQSLSNSPPTTRQPTANTERQDKRFVSELIIVAKTAQLFHSPLYQSFLDLLLQNLTSHKLVPYKITALAKFLLKPQNLTSVDKQVQLLNMLMNKMHSTDIMHEFDFITLKELYANLAAIVDNNSLMVDLGLVVNMIQKIQQYVIGLLPRMNSEEIYQFALYSLKRDGANNHKLGRYILQYAFSQILPTGQTSLNPLFILSLISTNVDQPIAYTSIDPMWEEKFINLYNRYLVSDKSYPNLSPYLTQIIKFVNFVPSTPIKLTIMQSFISATAIVPYQSDSFLVENHYLRQMDKRKMYASLYRLEEMRQSNQKTKGLLRYVFQTLQKSHISLQVKKQLYQTDKGYIKGAQLLKQNRQLYVKTLSRYCQALGHEELIYTIFYQSLISIVDNRASFTSHPCQKQSFTVPKTIDQKCRDKVNALFHNFIAISLQLNLKLTQKDSISMVEKLKANQFVMLIKEHELFADMFVEVLALRDVATVVNYYASEEGVDFLLQVLRFLAVKEAEDGNVQGQSCNNSSEKYYFVYYQILKNYPIQKLSKILLSPQSQQAIDKILNPKPASTHNKINSQGQSSTKASRAHFVYDKSTEQVYISEEQVKILRNKVQKCLEIKSSKGQSAKSL